MTLEEYIDQNDDMLVNAWDIYKYEHLGSHFHYDDVDYFNEEQFNEMCQELFDEARR